MVPEKMQENKDAAIKLFGKKIPVPADGEDSAVKSDESEKEDSCGDGEDEKVKAEKVISFDYRGCLGEERNDAKQEDGVHPPKVDEYIDAETSPETKANDKAPFIDEEKGQPKIANAEKEQNGVTNSQDKTLKKPDKILPCPRCSSMDTKFCYYNNYNVNQPRHFCRACQRYWTAGGTMRNVPVGAGRRKNKNTSSHYTHITISEALEAVQIDTPNGMHHPALKSNGQVLNFGLDSPVCNSMASVLSTGEKKVMNGAQNGFHSLGEKAMPVTGKASENGEHCSSGRKCTQEPVIGNPNCFSSPIPCLPGVTWPYPCHSAASPVVFYPTGFPVQFYSAAYWNCGFPSPVSVPFLSPDSCPSQKTPSSDPSSPKLGKHSREEDRLKSGEETEKSPKQKNGCVLIPKTLRIDDPNEAAKSSIWTTLGIKYESLSGGGIFGGFKSKSNEKSCVAETSPVLLANPAAMCRSLSFQESS